MLNRIDKLILCLILTIVLAAAVSAAMGHRYSMLVNEKALYVLGNYGFAQPQILSKELKDIGNGNDAVVFNCLATNASGKQVNVNVICYTGGAWKIQVP